MSLLKGESKTMRRKEKRARIEQIRVILGLSDSQRTPVVMLNLLSFLHVAFRFISLLAAHERHFFVCLF